MKEEITIFLASIVFSAFRDQECETQRGQI